DLHGLCSRSPVGAVHRGATLRGMAAALMPYLASYGVYVPILVSLWHLLWPSREAELFGAQLVVFGVWFVVAFVIQMFARTAGLWVVGLLAQVALAIVLILKQRIANIY